MKLLLVCIVLLYSSQYAAADVTLQINNQLDNPPQVTMTYWIKNHLLKYTKANSVKQNIFNQKSRQLVSFDPSTGQTDTLNNELLNHQVMQLNQQRQQQIQSIEKGLYEKLKDMSSMEQEVGESLLNQLKYPEFYGAHTQLSIKPLNRQKTINNINCKIYQLFRKELLLKEFCFADFTALTMSEQEYQTFRSFYAFDYNVISQMMLASGKTGFTQIDYEQHNMPGIVIETISYESGKITQHLQIKSIKTTKLNNDIFSLPSDNKTD